jgi:DNA-binding NarL/FixJ family response regulator
LRVGGSQAMVGALVTTPRQIGLVSSDGLRIAGLQAIFAENSRVEVVPLSFSGALRTRVLNVVLVDASSTDYLFELLATFRRTRPTLKLIVLGELGSLEYIERIIGAGAKGFLTHTASVEELTMALYVVQDGSLWAPRKVLARLLEARNGTRPPAGAPNGAKLTMRENQVVSLLVAGKSNREIGEALGIDAGTVKAHMGRIMRKTGVANRIELTMYILNQHVELRG